MDERYRQARRAAVSNFTLRVSWRNRPAQAAAAKAVSMQIDLPDDAGEDSSPGPPAGHDREIAMSGLSAEKQSDAPLAERLRPRTLAEVIGQAHLLGPGKPLALAFQSGQLHSMILWGPPGVGKTTLARLMADAFAPSSSRSRRCCRA
jgi:ABC-type glutathione transport system ATPase component